MSSGILKSVAKWRRRSRRTHSNFGIELITPLAAAELVKAGLPFGAIGKFHKASGFSLGQIKRLAHLSEGTLARRRRSGRFSPQESERLLRLFRIFNRAAALHNDDHPAARQWLETPIPALDNQKPIELSETEPGAHAVEDLIGRIEHGIIS